MSARITLEGSNATAAIDALQSMAKIKAAEAISAERSGKDAVPASTASVGFLRTLADIDPQAALETISVIDSHIEKTTILRQHIVALTQSWPIETDYLKQKAANELEAAQTSNPGSAQERKHGGEWLNCVKRLYKLNKIGDAKAIIHDANLKARPDSSLRSAVNYAKELDDKGNEPYSLPPRRNVFKPAPKPR